MAIVRATPKPESYVLDWEALRFDCSQGVSPARKLLKGTPWGLYLVITAHLDPYLVATNTQGGETWEVFHGDWLVKSPHGKLRCMSHGEFESQFDWEP